MLIATPEQVLRAISDDVLLSARFGCFGYEAFNVKNQLDRAGLISWCDRIWHLTDRGHDALAGIVS